MKHKWISSLALAAGLAFTGAAQAEVKFGVAGPITGAHAAFGAQLVNGAEMAVADINAAGGLLGQQIQLFKGDDGSNPELGVSVARRFAGDGVTFVVGHFNSSVSIPASDVYGENGIIMISPSSTNPALTEKARWNVFRTCGRSDQQGAVAGRYMADRLKGKKVAIVHDRTTYGKGLADDTRKTMNERGITEVLYEGVNTGEKNFSALVSRIRAVGAEVVYWGGLHTEGGLIVHQMRDRGVQAVLMSGDGVTSEEFASIGGSGVEGTLMTYSPDPRKWPEARDLVARFQAKNVDPEAYTFYSYASVQVIAQAAQEAKSLDPRKVADVIHSGRIFKTVIGDLSFDGKGDITRPDYVMYEWREGADGRMSFVEM